MAERSDIIDQHLIEGERLMLNRLYDRAMVEFNKALKLDSDATNTALEGLFHEAQATGNYEGVIAIGTNMLLHDQANSKLANLLGNCYRKQGNLLQAEKLYEHCLKYSPDDRNASYNLAATMARVDLYDSNVVSAIAPFERMESPQLPDNRDGEQRLLGLQQEIVAEQEKKDEEVEGDWQDELEKELEGVSDDSEEKKEQKIVIMPGEIFNKIRRDRSLSTEESNKLYRFLAIYCLENDYAEVAWRALTRLSLKDKSEDIQCFQALTYALRGEGELAIDKIVTLLGDNQYNRYANVNLGHLYQKSGKLSLAKKYFILTFQLLEKSKGYYDMDAFLRLGEKYYREGVYKNALAVFEVLKEEREEPGTLATLARIYLELDQFGKAVDVYRIIMKKYYDAPKVKDMMKESNKYILDQASDLMTNNKYTRAAQMYEISLEIDPHKETVDQAITAYKVLKDDDNIKRLTGMMRRIEQAERNEANEASRLDKIQEGKKFEKKALNYKAIQSYEEALRLKPEKDVWLKLVALYKKTRQHDMVEDVTSRYQKMIELAQRQADYESV